VLAYARPDGTVRVVNTDTGAVLLRDALPGLLTENEASAVRKVLGASADVDTPVRSPDGRWLAAGWPEADQLVFVRTVAGRQIRAVSNVSSQFRSRSFPTISGWCCAP
jgi:hypothetical protein